MKAAVTRAFGAPLSIETLSLAAPGPGEVHVGIRAAAICHSDLLFHDGGWGGAPPMVLGHEAAGEVISAGPGAGFGPGDRVAVTLIRGCGDCPCCASGSRTHCRTALPLNEAVVLRDAAGAPVAQGLKTAAFAEEVVVHESQLAPLGPEIGWAQAALLACCVITGYGAVTNAARMPKGATAVVIGAGGVGLNAVQGAALSGAARLIAVDLSDEKLAAARAFGATDGLRGDDPALVETVRRLAPGGADYVFVTVGATGAMAQAYEMLAVGGAAVLVGMPPLGHSSTFDPLTLADSAQRIIGSKMGQATPSVDIPALEALYLDGRLKLDKLITARFPFDEINAAFDHARTGRGVRTVLEM